MIDYAQLCREPSAAAKAIPPELIPSIQARVSAVLLSLGARLQLEHVRQEGLVHDEAVSGTDRFVDAKEAAALLGVAASWLPSNAWRLPFAFRFGPYGAYAPLRFSIEGIQRWRQYLKDELQSGGKTLRSVVRTKDFSLLSPDEQAELQSQPRLTKQQKPSPPPRWDLVIFNEPWRLHKRLRITIEEAAAIMGEEASWIKSRSQGTGHRNKHGLHFLRLSEHIAGGLDVSYHAFMSWLQYRRSKAYPSIKAKELRERWNVKR